MRLLFIGVAVAMSACGANAAPSAPSTPTPPSAPPATITLSGRVSSVNGGAALPGLSTMLGTVSTTTDGTGAFSAQLTPASSVRLMLTGAAIVPRALTLAAGSSRDVPVTAIALGGQFDLTFYRQFVRDGLDAPGVMRPLRRWTKAPSIYLRTIDDAGAAIDARTLDSTEAVIRESVPMWTAGTYSATVERGTDTRERQAGWITVVFKANASNTSCGAADVAVDGGTMDLYYRVGGNCRCAGVSEIRPRTVRHELGHAMGFWHTDSTSDVMSGLSTPGCDAQPSARERYHAAIAYQRPVGNADPDTDAAGPVYLAPLFIR